jgi:hypothetical protein
MRRIDEHSFSPMVNRGDFTRAIPFYGTQGEFNFTVGRSKFSPGISIKQVPLTNMSVNGDPGFGEFDLRLNTIRKFFKKGDRIRGILVNSHLSGAGHKVIVGKLHRIQPDYSNGTIRVWAVDPKTLEKQEVYADTIERIYESSRFTAMSFQQFLNS